MFDILLISEEKQAVAKPTFAFLDIISEKMLSNRRLRNVRSTLFSNFIRKASEVKVMDELMKGVKIGKLLSKDDKKETAKIVGIILGIVAMMAVIAGAAYAIYRFVNRDYYDDFEDDFDDLFEEDESDFEEE